jgi:hypothetical protein
VSKEREERTFENKTRIELRISLSPFLARGKGVVLFTYPTYVLEENPNKRLRERRERKKKKKQKQDVLNWTSRIHKGQ